LNYVQYITAANAVLPQINCFVGWIVMQAYVTDEPMVAFMCNRPAMHSTDNGWVSDDSSNCISDPVDILNYCRKVRVTSSCLPISGQCV